MAKEMNAPCQKEMNNGPVQQSDKAIITSAAGVKVMVVDDDVVCLSIVSGILRTWRYQVVTVRNAIEALSTLRAVNNFFNLVLTDVHMPEMDGYEFQRRVHEEFNLPVVMMSADDKETSILRGLETGAVFYIVKPVNFEDLRNIWQYAVGARRGRSAEIRNVSDDPEQDPPADENPPGDDHGDAPGPEPPAEKAPGEDTGAAAGPEPPVEKAPGEDTGAAAGLEPPVGKAPDEDTGAAPGQELPVERAQAANEANRTKTEPSKRAYKRVVVDKGNEKNDAGTSKKSKVVWNTPLHTRFLEAIRRIGLERAVPKKILEVMDTPGLTRENVASHLQKYRIFLKRVAEAGQFDGKNLVERALRSSFASGNPSLLISALQQGFPEFLNQHLIGTILQPGYPGNGMIPNIDPSLGAAILANPQASTGKTVPLPEANGGVRRAAKPRTQQSSNAIAMLNNNILGVRNMGFDGNSVTGNNQNRNLASTDYNVNSGYHPQRAQSSRSASSNPMSLFQLLSDPGTGGVDNSYWLESLFNNNAPVENNSPLQFSETDLDIFLRGHANSLRNNEQQAGEGVQNHGYGISLNRAGNKAPENQRFSNQMESGGDMMGYSGNGVSQLADHFVSLEPRNPNQPNQQQGGGGFQGPGPYNANPTVNPAWSQGGNNNDGMDSVFGGGLN